MTECNGCGGCCDPVMMPYTQEFALRHADEFPTENLRWILEDLTPMTDHIAEEKEPEFVRRVTNMARKKNQQRHFFSCINFDRHTRTCRIYEDRPPVCHGYPWLTGQPKHGTILPPACSYNADIGQPVKLTQKPN